MPQTIGHNKNSADKWWRKRYGEAHFDAEVLEQESTCNHTKHLWTWCHDACLVDLFEGVDKELDQVVVESCDQPHWDHDAQVYSYVSLPQEVG